jgi:metal-responsive CopG/Arc/MetJ family transcriptional regulator
MKTRISVSLSSRLMEELDRAREGESRSAFIERALRGYFRGEVDRRDREYIDGHADQLNAEAAEFLRYQTIPWGDVAL